MEFEIDKYMLEEFDNFIKSETFLRCITDNTTDLRVAMIILQTLINKLQEMETQLEEKDIEKILRG